MNHLILSMSALTAGLLPLSFSIQQETAPGVASSAPVPASTVRFEESLPILSQVPILMKHFEGTATIAVEEGVVAPAVPAPPARPAATVGVAVTPAPPRARTLTVAPARIQSETEQLRQRVKELEARLDSILGQQQPLPETERQRRRVKKQDVYTGRFEEEHPGETRVRAPRVARRFRVVAPEASGEVIVETESGQAVPHPGHGSSRSGAGITLFGEHPHGSGGESRSSGTLVHIDRSIELDPESLEVFFEREEIEELHGEHGIVIRSVTRGGDAPHVRIWTTDPEGTLLDAETFQFSESWVHEHCEEGEEHGTVEEKSDRFRISAGLLGVDDETMNLHDLELESLEKLGQWVTTDFEGEEGHDLLHLEDGELELFEVEDHDEIEDHNEVVEVREAAEPRQRFRVTERVAHPPVVVSRTLAGPKKEVRLRVPAPERSSDEHDAAQQEWTELLQAMRHEIRELRSVIGEVRQELHGLKSEGHPASGSRRR